MSTKVEPPNGGRVVGLMRLVDGVDIGLIGVGLTSRIAEMHPEGCKPGECLTVTHRRNVEVWVTFQVAQPSAIDGHLDVIEIPFRQVGSAEAEALVNAFIEMKTQRDAAAKPNLILV